MSRRQLEAIEEILTLHRLKVPGLLRKTLHSTNPIESMFWVVRDAEGNIKRYRNSRMKQRWLASVLREEIQEGKRVCLYIRCYQEYGGVRGDQRNCHDGSIGEELMRATQIISTKNIDNAITQEAFEKSDSLSP